MKKRRNLILSFVIVALLLIGIGYAAFSQDLTIGGTVTTEAADFDVIFTEVKKDGVAEAASVITESGHKVTLSHTGLKNLNDQVVFTITVKNNCAQFDAELNSITLSGDNQDYFEVTNTFAAQTDANALEASTGTYTFTVTVKLVKVPNEGTQSVTLTGTIASSAKAN